MKLSASFADDRSVDPPKVLLVDDDEVNLLLTGLALRERNFEITEAASGERALELLGQWTPDIIVLDALMPGLDGFATCQAIRALPGFEAVPILMLTGLDDDASITHAYEVGATDFFVKATQWSLLTGRLRYLLRASRTRIELASSKAKLARAQDLARMGSFDWWRSEGAIAMSAEGLRVFGQSPSESVSLRARCCAWCLAISAARCFGCCEMFSSTARCWPPMCRSRCLTGASVSSTSRPSPSSTNMARAPAIPGSCKM